MNSDTEQSAITQVGFPPSNMLEKFNKINLLFCLSAPKKKQIFVIFVVLKLLILFCETDKTDKIIILFATCSSCYVCLSLLEFLKKCLLSHQESVAINFGNCTQIPKKLFVLYILI